MPLPRYCFTFLLLAVATSVLLARNLEAPARIDATAKSQAATDVQRFAES